MSNPERRYWMCPECASGAFQPFDCGGPHPKIKKNGEPSKVRAYTWVQAVEMRPVDSHMGGITEWRRGA